MSELKDVRIVAEDHWVLPNDGERRLIYIALGAPEPTSTPEPHWECPVFAEEFTGSKVVKIGGVGPVDALINAAVLIRSLTADTGAYPRGNGADC